jgi:aryl-alcohol dehydrogenase-like predicted oxidoreductase
VASVIAGASTPEQVRANVAAGQWTLPDETAAGVDRIAPA